MSKRYIMHSDGAYYDGEELRGLIPREEIETPSTEGKRFNQGKPPLELVPETTVFAIAKVLEAGAKKYEKHNWRKGISISTQLGCLKRHLSKFESPHMQDFDEETKLHEMMMVACNVAMILETLVSRPELDDRFGAKEKMTTEEWLKHLGMK